MNPKTEFGASYTGLLDTINKEKDILDCNLLILKILSNQNELDSRKKEIIDEIEFYSKKNKDTTALIAAYHHIATGFLNTNNGEKAIEYFIKINTIYKKQGNKLKEAHNNMNIGTVYSSVYQNPDSSLYFTKKATPILKKFNDYKNLAYNYNNQALQYKLLGKYKNAIKLYLKADSIQLNENKSKTYQTFYGGVSHHFKPFCECR